MASLENSIVIFQLTSSFCLVGFPNLTLINETLKYLYIRNADLSDVDFTEILLEYRSLHTLDIYSTYRTTWPDFSAADNLQSIMVGATLNDLPQYNGFPPQNSLTSLYFHTNDFADKLSPFFFSKLNNLKSVRFINSKLTVFPNISEIIMTVEHIHLSGNKDIQTIDPEALLGVDNFTSPELPQGGYPSLTYINLHETGIDFFPSQLFSIFPELSGLVISKNSIKNIPDFSLLQHKLITLDFSYNDGSENYELSPYPHCEYESVLKNMTKLKVLHMSGNGIKTFPFSLEHIMTHFPKLEILGLKDNLIEIIPDILPTKTTEYNPKLQVNKSSEINWYILDFKLRSHFRYTTRENISENRNKGNVWHSLLVLVFQIQKFQSINQSIYPSIRPSICLSVKLASQLSVHLVMYI